MKTEGQDRIYHKTYFDFYPKIGFLDGFENLLEKYLPEKKGKILDVGCGQSRYILSMIDGDYEFLAIDDSEAAFEFLSLRISGEVCRNKIDCISHPFHPDMIKNEVFNGVVLSNILHFYNYQDATEVVDAIKKSLIKDSVVYVCVHSDEHPGNKLKRTQFKHFFSKKEIKDLFPESEFEYMYEESVNEDMSEREVAFALFYCSKQKENRIEITDEQKETYIRQRKTQHIVVVKRR